MSSSLTSPYILEERRLQGIVQQCSADLKLAMDKLNNQRKMIEQQRLQQIERDEQYKIDLNSVEEEQLKEQEKSKNKQKEKVKQLREMLQKMQIELETFSEHYGNMQLALERQNKLSYMLDHAQENLDDLEKKIHEHIDMTETEIREKSSEGKLRLTRLGNLSSEVKRINKGNSLKENDIKATKATKRESPLEIFSSKLDRALTSPYAKRISQLGLMKKKLYEQPVYARTAFAIKNMKQLDMLLKRLTDITQQNKNAERSKKDLVIKYKAICQLLDISPDEKLEDISGSTLKLSQTFEELQRLYQEKKKREYVSHAIEEVMKRHGIFFQDIGNNNDLQFSMENADLSVSGTDSDYLTLEVTGQYSGDTPTMNDRRKSTTAALHFCSILSEIVEELKQDFGIVFNNITTVEPNENRIMMKKLRRHSNKKYHENTKSMVMH